MVSVTQEQFEVRSELEAFHTPTGAISRAYPYSDPDDMLQSITVNWGPAGAPIAPDYAEQIRRVASQLLLERARREMKGRLVRHAA